MVCPGCSESIDYILRICLCHARRDPIDDSGTATRPQTHPADQRDRPEQPLSVTPAVSEGVYRRKNASWRGARWARRVEGPVRPDQERVAVVNVLPGDNPAVTGVDPEAREHGEAQPAAKDRMPVPRRRVVDVADSGVVCWGLEISGPVDPTLRVQVTTEGVDGEARGHEVTQLHAHETLVEVVFLRRCRSRMIVRVNFGLPDEAVRQRGLRIRIGEERVEPTRQIGA